MNRDGCEIGYERRGDACFVKNRIRNIPFSVNTRAGCLNFGGKWLSDYSVCVMHDEKKKDRIMGWTAPIRGLYFIWAAELFNPDMMGNDFWEWMNDLEENGKKVNPKDLAYEGSVVGCFVKENKEYPENPDDCHEAITPIYIWELAEFNGYDDPGFPPKFEEIGARLRDEALTQARRFMEHFDRGELHRYKYFDQAGRKLPMWRPDAIPVEIGASHFDEHEGPRFSGRRPFGIKRGLRNE